MRKCTGMVMLFLLLDAPVIRASCPQEQSAAQLLEQGAIAAQGGDFKSAVALLTRAQALDPRNPDILLSLGNAYSRINKPLEALAWLKAMLVVAPSSPSAVQVAIYMAELRGRVKDHVDKVLAQALTAAQSLDQSTPQGLADYRSSIWALIPAYSASGRYDAVRAVMKDLTLSTQDAADLSDGITIEQARILALRGDLNNAEHLLAQVRDLGYGVSGSTAYDVRKGSVRYKDNVDPRIIFWSRIANQARQDSDKCWTVNDQLAQHALDRVPRKSPYVSAAPGTMQGGGHGSGFVDAVAVGRCGRMTPVDLWIEFARQRCTGWDCEFTEGLEYASRRQSAASMAISLAQVAERVGRVLVDFDTLATRTR